MLNDFRLQAHYIHLIYWHIDIKHLWPVNKIYIKFNSYEIYFGIPLIIVRPLWILLTFSIEWIDYNCFVAIYWILLCEVNLNNIHRKDNPKPYEICEWIKQIVFPKIEQWHFWNLWTNLWKMKTTTKTSKLYYWNRFPAPKIWDFKMTVLLWWPKWHCQSTYEMSMLYFVVLCSSNIFCKSQV